MYQKKFSSLALRAMVQELDMIDKPGLVTPKSNGSHRDMDYFLMRRGIRSLEDYFEKAFSLGFFKEPFFKVRNLGQRAERQMFRATGGVNTHMGAIFQLGILVYLTGRIKARGILIDKNNYQAEISKELEDLKLDFLLKEKRFGARAEVASAYQITFESLSYKSSNRLYFIISKLMDTNILRRGGEDLLAQVQDLAKKSLKSQEARRELRKIIGKNGLSPGGAADILINSFFIQNFLTYEKSYSHALKAEILSTKEEVGDLGYENKIILSMVFPGWIKTNEKFLKYYNHYKKIYDKNFILIKEINNQSGYRAIYDLGDADPVAVKLAAVDLEQNSLIDIDVYGKTMVDRKALNLPQRKCLICDRPAKACMVTRRHDISKIIARSLEIINEN
ncbi:triphosphoribosyl-dephospho-CoA synthase [uncultured Ezakiella sp.]|uniref:triphosphoribosyl-dephospho-CoA synthase n=1 Tax=uncultured Ezakiella sp. TaxID=1637529 RepID=UPI0025FFA3B5|nr:triphosphoribosyl-dephospho-CoA synthase [uncultured Ezakiella sp.]